MTWSIVARDPATGELGAAVASRFFAVGAIVPWVAPRVGAVCTQALANPYLGPRLLRLLEVGVPPATGLEALMSAEPAREQRQVHAVAAGGAAAAFTGGACVDHASHRTGDGVSVAGNMLAGRAVIDATFETFAEHRDLPLLERLLRALRAGERAGGDKRGRQSAAVVVYGDDVYPELSLRADDHPDPIGELWRLYQVAHERYLGFRTGMPTRRDPAGVSDREILEQRIEAWLAEHGGADFSELWSRDPWEE